MFLIYYFIFAYKLLGIVIFKGRSVLILNVCQNRLSHFCSSDSTFHNPSTRGSVLNAVTWTLAVWFTALQTRGRCVYKRITNPQSICNYISAQDARYRHAVHIFIRIQWAPMYTYTVYRLQNQSINKENQCRIMERGRWMKMSPTSSVICPPNVTHVPAGNRDVTIRKHTSLQSVCSSVSWCLKRKLH